MKNPTFYTLEFMNINYKFKINALKLIWEKNTSLQQ